MEYKRLADIDSSSIEFEFLSNVSSYADKKETWLALGKKFTHFCHGIFWKIERSLC